VSAIAYLHHQKIRHDDLKPSNILLSPDQLWLTDFGSSTDFSLLSRSTTDNERGTPRYFAPE
jgi:serine/threonine protein kinase